jgi:hypothetical protein
MICISSFWRITILAMQYIAALNVKIEVALCKTFENASADFD